MKKIYNAQDINEANILKGLLETNNISATVDGFYLQGGIGELAPSGFSAISVEDNDAEIALEIIRKYEGNTSSGLRTGNNSNHFNKNLVIIPLVIIAFFVATLLLAQ